MATATIQNRPTPVAEKPQELSGKVSQQVSDILAEAERREEAQRTAPPALAYRVPTAGVRYYF